ncbi:hypothetical protein R3W88_008231 [Solanum pinnatisectum]|uniref:Uncharacterized protein n=1 Tax=Solanum pinnatisectum TaxID=50273 RepID=A0AAV9MAT8_9SOLN|nr:hypothetical protein R3W88_008231 [Solanum pinnatisectum]
MPNTRSKGAPLLPYNPEFWRTIRKMVNAQELEAQRQRLGLEAEAAATRDDADLNGAGATGAIVLPALPPGVKFTITSTMIQLLNLKGMFRGATSDDANQHLMNFVAICKSQETPRVNQTSMRLRLFPLSLTREATN